MDSVNNVHWTYLVNTDKINWTFCAKGLSLNVNLNNEVQCQMSILGNTK